MEKSMKNHTEKANRERLSEKVDVLTEENQRYFLGVLDALVFAQTGQGKAEPQREGASAVYPA
jgi:hypothetical protein